MGWFSILMMVVKVGDYLFKNIDIQRLVSFGFFSSQAEAKGTQEN